MLHPGFNAGNGLWFGKQRSEVRDRSGPELKSSSSELPGQQGQDQAECYLLVIPF